MPSPASLLQCAAMMKGSKPPRAWQAAAYRYEPWSYGFGCQGKSPLSLVGLWKKNLLFHAVSSVFSKGGLGTWLSSLRHFIKRLAQDFLPVLPVLFSGKTSCYDQNQSPFQVSWHTYVRWITFCHASIIAIMWWKGERDPKCRSPKSSNANALANEPSTHMERQDPSLDSQYVAWLWFYVWESLL